MTVQSILARSDRKIYVWISCIVGLITLANFGLLLIASQSDLIRLGRRTGQALIIDGVLLALVTPIFMLLRKKTNHRQVSFLLYGFLLALLGSAVLSTAAWLLMLSE